MKPNFKPGNVILRKSQSKCTKTSPHFKKSPALKELERLSLEAKRKRYPNNPYLVGDTYEDKTANGLTKAIIAFIRLKGGQAERINSTGRPIDRTKTFTDVIGRSRTIGRVEWIPGTGTNGSADISAVIASRAVKIEVKIGNDRQSAAQRNYQKQVVSAFGIYYLARNFESFVAWYEQMFKP